MAWQQAYNAYGTEQVIRQLIGIIYRDMQDALDFVSGAPGSLPPFQTYEIAETPLMQYPVITILPMTQLFDPDVVDVAEQTIQIFCAMGCQHQVPANVGILIQQYAMAVWHVLTAAWIKTKADFEASGLALPPSAYGAGKVTTGLAAGSLTRLFVTQAEYGELRRNADSTFVKAASMVIECELNET